MSVPEATNRVGVVLIEVDQARILVEVTQAQVVSEVRIARYSTPESRVVAVAVEAATAEPVAGRQGRKPEGIGAVSIRIPSVCCFEHFACR